MQKKAIPNVLAFLHNSLQYSTDNRDYIRDTNNRMLRKSCVVYAMVLAFYTVLVALTYDAFLLLNMYIIFDVIHAALCIAVFSRSPKSLHSYKATHIYCLLLQCSILSFFAVEGVFPFPNEHSLYIPIAITLIIIVFNHDIIHITSLIVGYLTVFVLCAYFVKPPNVFTNDLLIAVATFFASLIGYVLLSQLRYGERSAVKKLELINMTDALTGVYNKQTMKALCDAFILEHQGNEKEHYAFIVIDIDNFKRFNDLYGRHTGDEVLRTFSDTLKSNFRKTDIVGRFGGDEFMVLMDCGIEGRAIVEKRMRTVMASVQKIKLTIVDESLSCSAGIVLVNGDAKDTTYNDLFTLSDKALYQAKAAGKNRYEFCN